MKIEVTRHQHYNKRIYKLEIDDTELMTIKLSESERRTLENLECTGKVSSILLGLACIASRIELLESEPDEVSLLR